MASHVSALAFGDFEFELLSDKTIRITKYLGSEPSVTFPATLNGVKVTDVVVTLASTDTTKVTLAEGIQGLAPRPVAVPYFPYQVTELHLPSTLRTIAPGAFTHIAVDELVIPEGVEALYERTFYDAKLTKLSLPSSLRYVQNRTFLSCIVSELVIGEGAQIPYDILNTELPRTLPVSDHITSLSFPGTTSYVRDGFTVFNGILLSCTATGDVVIPEGVTAIAYSPWTNPSEITSITLPSTLKVLGHAALGYNLSLTEISLPEGLTYIGGDAFRQLPITHITIPDSVQVIDGGAFQHCTQLTDVDMGNGVLRLGGLQTFAGTFDGCSNLSHITFSDSLLTIGDKTFQNCTSLTDLDLPAHLFHLGSKVFEGCTGISKLVIPDSVGSMGYECLGNMIFLKELHVPANVTFHGAIVPWNGVPFLTDVYYAGAKENWTGTTNEYDMMTAIPTPCTRLPSEAFHYGNQAPTYLPDPTVNYPNLFLETVFLPNGTLLVKNTQITYPLDVVVPASIDGVPVSQYTVANVDAQFLRSLTFEATLDDYGQFFRAKTIVFPKDMTALPEITGYAPPLSNNEYLTTIALPDGITTIPALAFSGCTSLSNITLPAGITSIQDHAFSSCTALKELKWPQSLTSVGMDIFQLCSSLTDIYYAGTEAQWKAINFPGYNGWMDTVTIHYGSATPTTPQPIQSIQAVLSNTKMQVNGAPVAVEAYLIHQNNYIKLRDLATMVNGTGKNFQVTWNQGKASIEMLSNTPYTAVGGEMATGGATAVDAILNANPILLNGGAVELTAYTINQNNYFKLRDVMKLFNIGVGWDQVNQTATIDTNVGYTD